MRSSGVKPVAFLLAVLYLALLLFTWAANASIADWGIVRGARWLGNSNQLAILEVAAGGPAARAGLAPGDVILSVDGQVPNDEFYWRWTWVRRLNDRVTLDVSRGTATWGDVTPEASRVLTLEPRLAMPAFLVTMIVYTIIGSLALFVSLGVLVYRPSDLAARLLALGMSAYAIALLVDLWQQQFYQLWLTQMFLYLFVLGSAALLHLFLIFPVASPFLSHLRGLFPEHLRKWSVVTVLYGLPLGISLLLAQGSPVPVVQTMALAFMLLALAVLVLLRNYGRARGLLERAQLKWITFGLVFGVMGTAIITLVLFNLRFEFVTLTLSVSLWFFFPISVGIAILRYRLWNIDILIRRTLIYGALSTLLLLIYVASILSLEEFSRALTGEQQPEIVTVISTLAIAFLFHPLRLRIQHAIDHRFYRSKYDAAQVLTAFSAATRDQVDLDELTRELIRVVERTLQPEHVSLWLITRDSRRGREV